MKIAYFTEMGFDGKIDRTTHNNMRTEFAWMSALDMPHTPKQSYNVGSGHETSVRDLLSSLISALNLSSDYPIRELEGNLSDQFGLYADISNTMHDLGWKPQTSLDDGLRLMVDWARTQHNNQS